MVQEVGGRRLTIGRYTFKVSTRAILNITKMEEQLE